MRVVRVKMHQNMARFKIANAPEGVDCYPLPPFSTVNGFIHSMCQWKSYHKLDFFITGKGIYNTDFRSEWHGGHKFNKINEEEIKRWDVIVDNADGSHTGWVKSSKTKSVLVDLDTVIYIKTFDDSDVDDIYNALLNPPVYPSLGEYGDTCIIEDIAVVELKEFAQPQTGKLAMPAYIPVSKQRFIGTVYSLNYRYDVVRGIRMFEKVKCSLVDKGQEVESCLFDNNNPVVFIN